MLGVVLPQKPERLPEIVRVDNSIDFNPTSVSLGPNDPPLEFEVLLSMDCCMNWDVAACVNACVNNML